MKIKYFVLLAACLVGVWQMLDEPADAASARRGATTSASLVQPAIADNDIKPVPINPDIFKSSTTINEWIYAAAGLDNQKIRRHAWDIWGGLTAPSNPSDPASLPVYETWYSRFEVYSQFEPGGRGGRRTLRRGFQAPKQVAHKRPPETSRGGFGNDTRLIAGVKYNDAAARHVWANRYFDPNRLTEINASLPANPAIRDLHAFPDDAMALKPTYWIIKKDAITLLPYWEGPLASYFPQQPEPDTWKKFVAVDPSGKARGKVLHGTIQRINYISPDGKVRRHGTYPFSAVVISLDDFYASSPLTPDEVDYINSSGSQPDSIIQGPVDVFGGEGQPAQQVKIAAGDTPLLVGMHVSSKEIGNWTWQTFWWARNPQLDPYARDAPPTITGVWRHYAMKPAYSMVVQPTRPQSADLVTFNPYLETGLSYVGKVSNCMSCHSTSTWAATFPPPNLNYPVMNG
ncbi:MAG: hypothetical protein ACJ74J_20110 [Blastocatellia bacterium]